MNLDSFNEKEIKQFIYNHINKGPEKSRLIFHRN
jgi:hypothetical protein